MAEKAIAYAQAKSLKLKLTGELPLDAERVRAVRRARPMPGSASMPTRASMPTAFPPSCPTSSPAR
jgi:hypothetical protein